MDYCAPPIECTTGPLTIEIPGEPGVEVPTQPVTELPNTGVDATFGFFGALLVVAGVLLLLRRRISRRIG